MDANLRLQVEGALGEGIVRSEALQGGCINNAFVCTLASGEKLFIKSNPDGDAGMFAAESRGLEWLAEAEALRLPEVLHVHEHFLALEYIASATRANDYDEALGRGLARLHTFGAESFGFSQSGFLATLVQDNRPSADWPSFYSEHRLRPLLREAIDSALVPSSWQQDFERLFATMADLVGDPEKPARLHGDLWSGNLHCDGDGQPVLIDPAAYGGHREVDLAMLELFGSPSARFYGAYNEEAPLQSGYDERRALYQIYPLLAHILLFGSSYNAQCRAALASYV